MSALEKMREAFETCTVMAGVEPDFECIYITKDAANALFDEAEAENAKLRELVSGLDYCSDELNSAECERCPLYDPADPNLEPKCVRMMRELGIEVGE